MSSLCLFMPGMLCPQDSTLRETVESAALNSSSFFCQCLHPQHGDVCPGMFKPITVRDQTGRVPQESEHEEGNDGRLHV